jgi:biopolymer transport protein ExbD
MTWQVRHQGSPRAVSGMTLQDIVAGLRDGRWEPTDEVMGPGEKQWQAIEGHPKLADYAAQLEPPQTFHRDEATTLDMNALIDVCLVLLIFFILTTTYAAAVQKVVPMPAVKSDAGKGRPISPKDVKQRMIRLNAFLENGKIALRLENAPISALGTDGKTIDGDKLRDALKPYVRGEEGKKELLLDAREITWGTVIAIQDAAKSAGVRAVHYLQKAASGRK